jgi:hypothetical protein
MADSLPTRGERIAFLKAQDSTPLRSVIKAGLCPSIIWAIQAGPIVYNENILPMQEGNLYRETRRFYLFLEGHGATIDQAKREILFIQLLEMVDKDDAKMLVSLKDKKWPFKKLTKPLINEAFPDLIEIKFKQPKIDPEKDY